MPPLERLTGEGVALYVGVADCHGVVGGAGVVEAAGTAHGEHGRPTPAPVSLRVAGHAAERGLSLIGRGRPSVS